MYHQGESLQSAIEAGQLDMAAIYPLADQATAHRSTLQLFDPARRLVIECRYLADLRLLQIQIFGRDDVCTGVVTLQGDVAAAKFQRVGPYEYLQLGQAVLQLDANAAADIRAWLAVEVRA